jgi:sulfonate transport system substrate-binding protein
MKSAVVGAGSVRDRAGRRSFVGMLAAATVLVVSAVAGFTGPAAADAPKTLRIGVQKYGTLIVLQVRGALEKRLAPLGTKVEWTEFAAGPPLLEALAAGSIDFGTTGEAPPVFAQAAGTPFLYAGVEPSAPAGEAILVPQDSPIRTVADLKGKRLAFFKGSNVHYFVVRALENAGVGLRDVQPVYLAPADARAAFERGSVDAWGIWDPYYAAGQKATGARILTDGTGLVRNHQFYLASRILANEHADLLRALLEEIAVSDAWASEHRDEVAALLAPRTGLDAGVIKVALARLAYGLVPLDDAVVGNQQAIADAFYRLNLIPKPVAVREAVWTGAVPIKGASR